MPRCTHPKKVRYTSKKAAKRALREIYRNRAAGHGRLHVYECAGHWHVGHTPRKGTR